MNNIDTPEKILRRVELNREREAAEAFRVENLNTSFTSIRNVFKRSLLRTQIVFFGLGAVTTQLLNWII